MLNNGKDAKPAQEEYQFKEEGDEGQPKEPTPDYFETQNRLLGNVPQSKKNPKIKRLLIPVVLVVVIFIVYNFLNWYSTKKSQTQLIQEQQTAMKMKEQPGAAVSAPPAEVKMPQVPAAAVSQPRAIQTLPNNISPENQQMNALAKETEAAKQQLGSLDVKISQNQEALLDINQRLADLTVLVQNLQAQVGEFNAKLQKPKKVKKAVKQAPLPLYYVHAIVPGRAWLESSDGETLTVTIGDKIKGYGVVEMISPKQGMIVMSSGTIFQYGANDF